jgi:HAD superfamily hydrolase (TIGR01509 family)
LLAPHAPCLVIFDHDGVLVDTFELHLESWLELGRRTGLPFTRSFLHETFGMTNPSIFRRLLGDAVPSQAEVAHFGEIKEECYRDAARHHLRLMPGVQSLLDELTSQRVRMAIGSSAPRANLELTIEVCGLAGRFDALACLEDISHGKPDPEVFLVAARKAGVEPVRSLVFEDAVVGVQAAKAAGMLAVGVGTSRGLSELETAGVDLAVPNLLDFPTQVWVDRLRNAAAR